MPYDFVLQGLNRINAKLFFVTLLLFQILFIFQGLDFADEGFHSTFYQQIYNEPESVQYNFMYWFSGILSGAWLSLFPKAGLLWLRIGGVLLTTLTAVASYQLLKKYINTGYLKLGLLFILLMNCASVKDLNYNNISALLAVFTVLFLFKGLKNRQLMPFFLSGLFLSLATFTRLSNAAGLSLAAVIVYSGFFIIRKTIVWQLKQLIFFAGGFGITTLAVIGIMKLIGHYNIFMNCLGLLNNMAKSQEGNYGLMHLIKLILSEYVVAVFKLALPVAVLIVLITSVYNYVNWKKQYKKLFYWGVSLVAVIIFIGFVKMKGVTEANYFVLLLFAAVSLAATIVILISKNNSELKILALAGTIMTLMLVSGSDVGFVGSGAGSFWIGLPIAVHFFFSMSFFSFKNSILYTDKTNGQSEIKPTIFITEKQLQSIRRMGAYLLIAFMLFFGLVFTYNDSADRRQMVYSINNNYAAGIFTTKERATAVNELLEQCSLYMKKNDYVLGYETMPMFHALTKTKPFIRNSWPKLYDVSVLRDELSKAVAEKKILPVVIYQKVKTTGSHTWPDLSEDNSRFDMDQPKNIPIRDFLDTYHYQLVWENVAFKIYLPGTVK
jgi:hypothetical protein